jgi:hypothetical protein
VRAGVTDSTVDSVLRRVETRVAAKGIELYSFASSDAIKTTRPLLDLLRGPAPYAFVSGHCAVGYFEKLRSVDRGRITGFLWDILIAETNHRFRTGAELLKSQLVYPDSVPEVSSPVRNRNSVHRPPSDRVVWTIDVLVVK